MERVLIAKMKLGFIDGMKIKPDHGSTDFERWRRCDSMVACWILNSITAEIFSGFIYTDSARALWMEVYERYR